jgi:Rad3-related DNA helicase
MPSRDPLVPWHPRDLGLSYERWRPGQRRAIRQIFESEENVAGCNLPTGFGKSGIGVAMQLLGRIVVLTATRNLQDQYGRESDRFTDIRGMNNYECRAAHDEHRHFFRLRDLGRVMADRGYCNVDVPCSLKSNGCVYFDQVREAMASSMVSTNYAYWLGTRIHGRGFGHADVVVADEAHALVEQITSALRIEIRGDELRGKRAPSSAKAWGEWATARLNESGDEDARDPEVVHAHPSPERDRALKMLKRLGGIDGGWAWEPTTNGYAFEPITPARYLRALWTPPTRLILLSATMTRESLRTAGIEPGLWIEADSPFPLDRRPVYVIKTAYIDYRTRWDDLVFWLDRHVQIIMPRRDRNGVIHSGSYKRQQLILRHLQQANLGIPIFAPTPRHLIRDLDDFRCARRGAVLISPAVTTGVDLPRTDCEYQILSKVPFPDARAGIAKARYRRIAGYKHAQIMQTIVQAYGRAVRFEDDAAEFFIIDNYAEKFLRDNARYAPEYFNDAVEFTRAVPRPPARLAA